MLLAPAWKRLLVAGLVLSGLWAAVLWVAPSRPAISPARPPALVAPQTNAPMATAMGPLRSVVRSGQSAPGGGHFDRFDVPSQPAVAPVNARGEVAFYATVLRAPGREGIFVSGPNGVRKVASVGDDAPGGGTFSEFATHALPALNATGHVAFVAEIAKGRSTEGLFLAGPDGLRALAFAGDDAPGVPYGVIDGFDAPALNDNDEMAFVAEVRRGQDMLDVLYFWNGMRLQRIVAERDLLLRIGGTMDQIGAPALNNSDVIAFPASIFKGPVLGGIFVAGSRALSLLVGAGDRTPDGGMILRFSERVAIDDEGGIAFEAYLTTKGGAREAVLRIGAEGLTVVAAVGDAAPEGGRYAGFGPWPTVGPAGVTAFIAALDGGPSPLAAFAGRAGDIKRVVSMGETLSNGMRIGRFALNAVAAAGPGDTLTFITTSQDVNEASVIYCRCPQR